MELFDYLNSPEYMKKMRNFDITAPSVLVEESKRVLKSGLIKAKISKDGPKCDDKGADRVRYHRKSRAGLRNASI